MQKSLDAVALTAEMTERFTEEIDYRIEAENQSDFCKRYAGHPYVRIPSVVPELSSRTVLTTEWIDGLRWKDFVATASQTEKDRVGEILYRFTSGGLRRYGIFQADAHPGNIIVEPKAAWVAFLDFGLVKRFTPTQAAIAQTMADAVFEGDMIDTLAAAESVRYFPPGHKISAQRFSAFLEPVRALFGEAGTFTPEKHERSIRVPFDPKSEFQDVVRAANAPAATVLQDRLSYGLSALLADLRATADWPNICVNTDLGIPRRHRWANKNLRGWLIEQIARPGNLCRLDMSAWVHYWALIVPLWDFIPSMNHQRCSTPVSSRSRRRWPGSDRRPPWPNRQTA